MFTILQPCTKRRWDQLPGDSGQRFCDACGENVHAVSARNAAEIRERVATGQKVCGLLPMAPTQRRFVLRAALLAAAQPLLAGNGQLRVKVIEPEDSPREGARIEVLDRKRDVVAEATSGPDGIAVIGQLPRGDYFARASLGNELATFGDACVFVGTGTAQLTLVLVSRNIMGTISVCGPTPAWRRWLSRLTGR